MWCISNADPPHQQCAAIIRRLGGTARAYCRTMEAAELMNGGIYNGVQVDPVTLLFNRLGERFAQLHEETRLVALTNMLEFRRNNGERINELLTRFEITLIRAQAEANFQMNFEGLAYMLLKVVGVNDVQLQSILQPTGGQFPTQQPQFTAMMGALRRMGHILENQPGNIASSLRGRSHASTTSAFPAFHGQDAQASFQARSGEDGYPMPPLEIEDASGWWPAQTTYDSQGWSFASLSRTEQDHQGSSAEVDRSMEVTELSGTDTDSSSDEYERWTIQRTSLAFPWTSVEKPFIGPTHSLRNAGAVSP